MNTSNPYSSEFQSRAKTTPRTNEVAPEGQDSLFDLLDVTPTPEAYVATQTTCAMCDVDPLAATVSMPVEAGNMDATPAPDAPVVATKTPTPEPVKVATMTQVVHDPLYTSGPISDEAKEDRDTAMALVAGSHSDRLKRQIADVVLDVAKVKDDFIAADVADALGDLYASIKDPRVIGPILKAMQKNGNIQPTGEMRVSPHRRNHGRYMRVWKLGDAPNAPLTEAIF